MRFEEKSYSTSSFRPRPEIHVEPDGSLLIVATPWGPRASARKAVQIIQSYFLSSRQDREATSPFSRLTCLSSMGNDLRIAVKLANDMLYNEENKDELATAVELFTIARNHQETVWVQIGHPFALLDRPGESLAPLGNHQDLAFEFSKHGKTLSPLPSRILGIETTSDFAVESFRTQPADKIILVSRSNVPAEIYGLLDSDRNLQNISSVLSNHGPNLPFWTGICHLN